MFSPSGRTNPPPSVLPFLLAQNHSPKNTAESNITNTHMLEHLKLYISQRIMQTLAVKGATECVPGALSMLSIHSPVLTF